ncbi:MAG: sigma-54-dependent Fis family transcriptional regulator [Deltaproteobacteria bacterium]|nr:sigma-54-dependent Fis family transcriptional regulator [Deltaproteobacteria bacterium]
MEMIRSDHWRASGRASDPFSDGQIPELSHIITQDFQLQQILANLPTYAISDLPVLLLGEPGTGKELVAQALCTHSLRRNKQCYAVNCGALTESLACSELFGHVKGAFTDARQGRPGKFKLAHGGSLFLDEVGDLPLSVQSRLLRAVELGEIDPVGADTPIRVDVRLVAATNQNLPQLIAQGRFRQDLYDRLAVLTVHLPPLRERGEDAILLAERFLYQLCQRHQREVAGFARGAEKKLLNHSWPGNVRELRNVVTRAFFFSKGPLIRESDLRFNVATGASSSGGDAPTRPWSYEPMVPARPPQEYLEKLLRAEGGNVSALSRRLRVSTKTVYRWLKSHRIDLEGFRSTDYADLH